MRTYRAPWGTRLIATSLLATTGCGAVAAVVFSRGVHGAVLLLLLLSFAVAVAGRVRGYSVTSDAVLVHRGLWTHRLPLAGLQSARFLRDAMGGSLRIFGNGGLFSFCGFYRSKSLGSYRAFVTDPQRTVVLRFSSRTVVVSPAEPERFVQDVEAASALAPGLPHRTSSPGLEPSRA